jgi:hypothetical protein
MSIFIQNEVIKTYLKICRYQPSHNFIYPWSVWGKQKRRFCKNLYDWIDYNKYIALNNIIFYFQYNLFYFSDTDIVYSKTTIKCTSSYDCPDCVIAPNYIISLCEGGYCLELGKQPIMTFFLFNFTHLSTNICRQNMNIQCALMT